MPRLANEKREAFCRHYAASWDIGTAARAAGYKEQTGRMLACEPDVAYRISELSEMLLKKQDITAERVMLELARVGFSDIRKIVGSDGRLLPLTELDDDIAASIAGVEVEHRMEAEKDLATGETRFTPVVTTKIKKSDKVAALNILAKHFKLVGDEGDGVNALASALADRLNTAKRVPHVPRVINSEEIEDATYRTNHVQPGDVGERRQGEAVPQPGDRDRPDAARE